MSKVEVKKVEKEVVTQKPIEKVEERYTTVTQVIPKVVFYEIRDSNAIRREYDRIIFLRITKIRPFYIL